jgi:DEAD/DEAH box helicase domain-containing protein
LPIADRKLVAFSDSREDAAQIANGVERNHYRTLIRELTADELEQMAIGEPALLEAIETGLENEEADDYERHMPNARKRLTDLLATAALNLDSLPEPARLNLEEPVRQAQERLKELSIRGKNRIVPVQSLLPLGLECGPLVRRLLTMGVNPAGNDLDAQELYWDNTPHRWTDLFDMAAKQWLV